jgi:hypothetical protein
MALMRCSSAGVFGTGHSYVFPCARTDDAWVRIMRIILEPIAKLPVAVDPL